MKRTSLIMSIAMLALVAITLPSPAAAKDAVWASVVPITPATSIPVRNNGNPLSPGTFAIGTIQLFYEATVTTFPVGAFGSFTLNLGIKQGPTTGQQTQYLGGIPLTLTQTGSQNLTLTPATSNFSVTGQGWTASTTVDIDIPPKDPSLDCSVECDLVGNLQIVAPGQNHLDTPTTIQVHIKVIDPPLCLGLYNFLTDEAVTTIVTDTLVNLRPSKNGPVVASTNPFGQFSDNVLIVNTCGTAQTFNLGITLDSHFETNPRNNPGNAVFTYLTGSVIDPSAFDIADFLGTKTAAGQNLWFTNITVPAGSSFLVTVHIQLIRGQLLSALPLTTTNPLGGLFAGFYAGLYTTSTNLTSMKLGTGILAPLVAPNPDTTTMSFTVQ